LQRPKEATKKKTEEETPEEVTGSPNLSHARMKAEAWELHRSLGEALIRDAMGELSQERALVVEGSQI